MSGALSKILLISRAVAADQPVRRKAMLVLLSAALGMVFVGCFILWNFFVEHPLFFAIYWLACGWLVVTAVLLAVYDIVCVLRDARSTRRSEQKRIFTDLS
ncbi:MAG: hypothetical protein ACOVMP_12185 [Chthoniobacterales bacterium]